MKTTTTQFLKACSLSVALLGSAAVVMTVSVPDAAYADNGKGNGNGGGNGNGNSGGNGGGNSNAGGNGGGSEKAGGNSGGNGKSVDFSKSGKAAEKAEKKAAKKKVAKVEAREPTEVGETKAGKVKLKGVEDDDYAHPSELGALNAAHANPRALENASPNSRVGRIAEYRDLVLEGRELAGKLEDKLDDKTKLLEAFGKPRDLDAIDEDIRLAGIVVETKVEAVDTLVKKLAAAGGVDEGIEKDLAAARTALTEAEEAAQDLQDERTAAVKYAALEDEIAELTDKLADQPDAETEALEAAANKEVTDDVEATVKKLLGL